MTPLTTTAASGTTISRRRPAWFALWPLLPIVIYLAVLFIYPVVQLLWLSVVDNQGELTRLHYARLFASAVYVKVLGITFRIALWTTVFAVIASYPVAYLLATATERTRNNLLLWVLMPFWTSFLVRTFAWIVLLGRKGAINAWLQQLGIVDAPAPLIYNFAGVMIGMVHALMPLAVVTMLAVMRNIDENLPKAAGTLGARGGQSFWRVYFPLSLPGVASGALLVFIVSLGFFITPALLGSGREIMIAQVIIEQMQELLNWSFSSAVAVLLLGTTVIVFFLYDHLFGLSSMSDVQAVSAASSRRVGWISWLGALAGTRCIALMGWICDRFGEAMDRIRLLRPDRPRATMSRKVLWLVAIMVIVYLVAPSFFVIPMSFSEAAFIQWPPIGFTLRNYEMFLTDPIYVGAMLRSLVVAFTSAALAMLIGVPAAFVLMRQRVTGKGIIFAGILAPMIIPHIIIAIALFYLYAQLGLIGTTIGLVLGHTVVSVPFVVVTIMAVLKNYNERLDQAAWSLGANKLQTLRHITFPLILPGLIAAYLFAFVISLDELTIALFVSGGQTPTLPKQMWVDAIFKVNPMVTAVSTVVLVFVTSLILVAEVARRRSEKASGT
jgi:ABC-type spermidine/putrescine transport system permease subunit I